MITAVNKYENNIYIRFDKGGDAWKNVSKLPHYKTWIKILTHLKNRGFSIKTPQRFIDDGFSTAWGKSTHKVAYKNNVAFILELMDSQIKIEFGDMKNIWEEENNFWSSWDKRSKALTYLETKRIELEVNKVLSIFNQDRIVYNYVKNLSPEQKILKNKKESCHNKDAEKLDELGLDGIVYQMSDYDHSQNSFDKDKKKINCGDLKYFYDYDKRLKCGRVYHNLNNMWWVLTTDNYHNKSSWELFDYDNQPRRKVLTKEQKINRLESELREYETKKNYQRCIAINKQIDKLKAVEKVYHIWSLKWNKWWGANNNGYTSDKKYTGVYLESNVKNNQSYYNDGVSTKAVLINEK